MKITAERFMVREAYARNGNTQNPTKQYAWRAFVDGRYAGTQRTRRAALALARDAAKEWSK